MFRHVLRSLRPAHPRRLAVPSAVLLICGLPALAGTIIGDPLLSGGGLGILAAALPPALLWALAGDPPEDGHDDHPGSGGPDDPPDPDQSDGNGLDWAQFDAQRRDWERRVCDAAFRGDRGAGTVL